MLLISMKRSGLLALFCGLLAFGQTTAIAQSPASKAPNAEAIYTELDRLTEKPCEKQEKTVGNVRYSLCSFTDEQGIIRLVSAASSHPTAGDGAGYWLNGQGEIYAIRYFHSGQTFVLLEDTETVVELVGNREIKVISDKARWMGLELGARDNIMTISEQFD
jgi:hypothetical protein